MRRMLPTLSFLILSLSILAQCPGDLTEVEVVINEDNYPNEISWTLYDEEFNALMSGDNEGDVVCVPSHACLTFEILDSYGDGICCGYGQGSYVVYFDGQQVATGGDYDYSESVAFNCPEGYSCNQAEEIDQGTHIAEDGNKWYSYTPDINGSYFITTCGQGNSCDTKIWVYEYCDMNSFSEDNAATIYYDDDQGGCGDQARLNVALLEGGVEYWIRIGDDGNDCSDEDIQWTLGYNGPISGCMDDTACNYNPLAEEDDGSCIPVGDPECPDGPDLIVLGDVVSNSMYLTTLFAEDGNCYIPEGCLNGYGQRDILRFTTHIKNIGNQDYYIGSPSANPDQFDLENCHNHTHYKGYAEYLLYGLDGIEVPIGFKNGFCVLDLECSDGGNAQYGCSNMGISAQCGDIYSSGLSCQWIDITDTPDGTYTMVVRTNWDQDPDALGRHELDYSNNWAQVCIEIDRSSGQLTVTEDTECDPFVDCAGEIYGSARPDCTGECNGTVLSGDANGDYVRNMQDASEYVSLLVDEESIPASPCIDLDADGEITISDAAAMALCVITDADHEHPPGEPDILEECVFPISMPINIFDEVTFSISEIDMDAGYFEVSVLNPMTKILAYELDFEGVDIVSAVNLIDDGTYPITPMTGLNGSKVIGMSYNDEYVERYTTSTPLVRIYFSGTPTSICLVEVVEVVNETYEKGVGIIESACGSCAADITGDGWIDVNDIIDLNSMYGEECTDCPEDISGDGVVDVTDFIMMNSSYGQSCIALMTGEAIEDPISVLESIAGREDIDLKPGLMKAIRDVEADRKLIVYPNPNAGPSVHFLLTSNDLASEGYVQCRILDLSGKEVARAEVDPNGTKSGRITMLNTLPSGSYFIELVNGDDRYREQLTVVR